MLGGIENGKGSIYLKNGLSWLGHLEKIINLVKMMCTEKMHQANQETSDETALLSMEKHTISDWEKSSQNEDYMETESASHGPIDL